MRVLQEAEASWFLLEQDGRLYLDVNCSNSFVGYSWLIELNEDERARLVAEGRTYLDSLAYAIHYSVPAGPDSTSPYRDRNNLRLQPEVMQAVREWQAR